MLRKISCGRMKLCSHGDWCVDGRELNVWVDASSFAIGVALERHKTVLEDACWLRPENDAQHINLAELDAVLKGINLALQWQCKVLHVKINSLLRNMSFQFNHLLVNVRINSNKTRAHNSWYNKDVTRISNKSITAYSTLSLFFNLLKKLFHRFIRIKKNIPK